MHRRTLVLGASTLPLAARAQAPDWPSRPIRLIVPFPPGGPNDIIARLMAPQLTSLLGQTVVIENRGGGGGVVGTDAALKSPPDGYTLAISNGGSLVITPHVSANVPYRVPQDVTMISVVARMPEALVATPSLGLRSLPDLIARARQEPGRLNIGTAGAGGISHLAAELLKQQAGVNIVVVPYRGAAPAVTDLVAGQIQLLFADMPVLLPQIRIGALVPLAMASTKRSPSLPEVPTTGEFGYPGVLADNWYALLGPAGLPEPILRRLSAAARQASQAPEYRDGLAALGTEASWTSPEEFAEFVQSESKKWEQVALTSGIRLD